MDGPTKWAISHETWTKVGPSCWESKDHTAHSTTCSVKYHLKKRKSQQNKSVRESFTWGPNLHAPPVTRSHNLSSLATHAGAHAIDFYFDILSKRRPWFKIIVMIISVLGKDRVLAVLPRGSSVRPLLWDLWHERHVKLGVVFIILHLL
jgi:hypothetical protein